jgi:hypothetical protein
VTLTNRLLAFFLTMLGLVLHGIAVDRLDAALETLAAAAELRPDGVEWDLLERRIPSLIFLSFLRWRPPLRIGYDRSRLTPAASDPEGLLLGRLRPCFVYE